MKPWEILERHVEDTFPGAKRTDNSGAKHGDGDLLTSRFLIECKTHGTQEGISADKQTLLKARQQALKKGRQPLLVIENQYGEKWVLLPYDEMVRLQESLRTYESYTQMTEEEP